ncbi:aldose 1-epimerase family protein [Zavarzinia compransoris]|uniref:aldose 1-epimerase family protein n=1 Tax=Zavarzinia marina TaxID=2911065 RepID=UPI001F255AEF|nr:aldose 1-epimerase family protein [Zavarzinia marina]MCF4166164.1 aldose 1-epimerase family protein [Zavarzinia marina]
MIRIAYGDWRAAVKPFGAELSELGHEAAGDLLWPAIDPWPRHAPNLFPIVGRLAGDRLVHRGRSYPMRQHGFARDREFAVVAQGESECRLRLEDDAETRARYPFAFRLDIVHRLDAAGLHVTYEVTNPGDEVLPASVGAHPAFRWPLDPAAAKTGYWLTFDQEETAPVRRLDGGLVMPDLFETPIRGRRLDLDDALFEADALILDAPVSKGLVFAGPGRAIRVAWGGFRQLGLWMKPGAGYLCIEPWAGFASPIGFDGEFTDKPGLLHLAPGETRAFSYAVDLAVPEAAG